MWEHLIAILGLSLLCGGWVVVQRWLAQVDPGTRSIESGCGSCGRSESS